MMMIQVKKSLICVGFELKVVEMMVSLMVLWFFHSFSVDPEKMQPELVLLVLLGVKLLISLH
uniref:Uncharacterized protein n=1 Tax=Chenopodium quinoa TaxID=63459 RepID=A0A803NCQ1_CHEQI